MDGHLGLHDVDLLLAGRRQDVDLLHPGLVDTVQEGDRGVFDGKNKCLFCKYCKQSSSILTSTSSRSF